MIDHELKDKGIKHRAKEHPFEENGVERVCNWLHPCPEHKQDGYYCTACSTKVIYSGRICYDCWEEWANTDFLNEYYEVNENEEN